MLKVKGLIIVSFELKLLHEFSFDLIAYFGGKKF